MHTHTYRGISANIGEIFRQLGIRLHSSLLHIIVVVIFPLASLYCNHNIEYNSIINIIMSFQFFEGVKSKLPHSHI